MYAITSIPRLIGTAHRHTIRYPLVKQSKHYTRGGRGTVSCGTRAARVPMQGISVSFEKDALWAKAEPNIPPIIVLPYSTSPEDSLLTEKPGARGYFVKSVDLNDTGAMIETLLGLGMHL